jgi:hypothetical protein
VDAAGVRASDGGAVFGVSGMSEIKFKCPHGDHSAIFYSDGGFAGCIIHGVLLYTDIPPETRKEHKSRWTALISSDIELPADRLAILDS